MIQLISEDKCVMSYEFNFPYLHDLSEVKDNAGYDIIKPV